MISLLKKLLTFVVPALLLLTADCVFAHDLPMAASRWSFARSGIVGEIDLKPALFSEIKPIKAGNYDVTTIPRDALPLIARKYIQPYIDEKLSITVNGKKYPIRVDLLDKNENSLFTIRLSAPGVEFEQPDNKVRIDYGLLFEETKADHVNLASAYFPESGGNGPQTGSDALLSAMQGTFDLNNQVWELSVKGVGTASANGEPGGAKESFLSTVREFIPLGIEHILTGYDHIAFLLALIVIWLPFKEILKIITAFTAAHSITLLLAAMQIVRLDSRFVESVIALSICYVAIENLLKKKVNYRWVITFCFGLVHGFGFASALQELIVGRSNLLLSVISFNAGVEVGQLMIVCAMLPLLCLLKKVFEFRTITAGASIPIFLLGFAWFLERVFDLKLLWF